jgi:release factor glutamine methyltransferase
LLVDENKPKEIVNIMKDQYGMNAEIIMQRRAGREKQFIVKIQHQK